jgi:hypothetical protein
MKCQLLAAALLILIGDLFTWRVDANDRILFIRGGNGTVGFLEGGSDEQGADISNYATNSGNHGWGELASALAAEGFEVEQLAENPVAAGVPKVPTPVPLETMNLSQYAVIVFGSNNAEYTTAQVDAFVAYVQNGGAGLFISDANFGQNWGDAPSSDQAFLSRFGLTMNQDQGTYLIRRTNEFLVPAHPILNGVENFDGEGVSPISATSPVAGVTSTILTAARNNVRRNAGAAQGPSEPVTASDGSLVIATYGSGRIAGHFDRNTFFNLNGAGASLNRFQNEAYARNLFNWLAGRPDFDPLTDNYAPRGHYLNPPPGATFADSATFTVDVEAKDPDGTIAHVDLFVDGQFTSRDLSAPFQWTVSGLGAGTRELKATVTDNEGATTDVIRLVQVTDMADSELPLGRSAWVLSASVNNTAELANAIDGVISTRWPTRQFQTPGQTFRINFTQRQLFQRIVLETPNNPEDYPRGYIVRGSDDNITKTVLATGNGTGPTTNILLPAPVTFQYLEIEQTGSSPNRWWSIHEINIYHPPANAVLPLASWLQFHFGADLNDPAKEATHWGFLADFDDDGSPTLEEFAFRTSPLDSASRAGVAFASGVDSGDGRRHLDLTYRRWLGANGIQYVTEASDSLGGWISSGLDLQLVGTPVANRDGTETVTLRLKAPLSAARYFGRLRLTLAP